MSSQLRSIVLSACALGLIMLPAAVNAQGPDRGGFGIQIGPGGVQLSPGNDGRWNNNPGWNNNWNSNNPGWNNNNWNNDWNRWDRRPGMIRPEPMPRVPVTPPLPTPPAEPILLVNPASTQAAVQYRVNQYSYVLRPGSTQQLDGYRTWTIDFDRGGNYGRQQYGLAPGRTYRFAPGARGWELFVVTTELTEPLPSPPAGL